MGISLRRQCGVPAHYQTGARLRAPPPLKINDRCCCKAVLPVAPARVCGRDGLAGAAILIQPNCQAGGFVGVQVKPAHLANGSSLAAASLGAAASRSGGS